MISLILYLSVSKLSHIGQLETHRWSLSRAAIRFFPEKMPERDKHNENEV
jgi:hypothetical protein